jgi:tryptophan synthase beta chain
MLEKPSRLYDKHEIARYYFNIVPFLEEYLGEPLPLPKGTDEQMERVQRIIVPECLEQEMSMEPWIKIPKVLRELYHGPLQRPRILRRLKVLEQYLGTLAEIWLMPEGFGSPTGSHKINTAVAQALYALLAGKTRLITETGAGQWGSALSAAVVIVNGIIEALKKATGLDLKKMTAEVYWVRNVMQWKPGRLQAMVNYDAKVYPSPSEATQAGRDVLAKNPDHPGDLGIAISEGVETAMQDPNACYVLGSVLNHVLMHQTINGLEVMRQLEENDRYPDYMVGCFGGGSNFGGFILPILGQMLAEGKRDIEFVACQNEAFPNLVKGEYKYGDPDHAGLLPQLKMFTLGTEWSGDPIRAGGLEYHGAAPILSFLRHHGYIRAWAFPKDEKEVLEAMRLSAKLDGWHWAAESGHGLLGAIKLALEAKGTGRHPIIVVNASGRADMEMETYK